MPLHTHRDGSSGGKEVLARMGRKWTPHTLLVGAENDAKKIMKKMMQPW